ncbi:dehydrogenase/reductase SDR family protein 7-like [Leptinotarsa decemlineata]|uniref:dehydrogenase/reductase SDR family protein 7-like n=1 Tax=Leptinotarsa decemlineata TaxID=7539 RepID=UPI000C252FC7|nr:dehydrogenase/reductase SDR family protein 7-like [Leptinotarsa decemlineata]XP_023025746.1 dehydrogenase/reductase SDR family protein 7-like [Leptinotarsa decemlineata]
MFHFLELMFENKMSDAKKLYESLSLVGSFTLAISLPWIILRVFRALYLQKGYNELFGKVVVITGASSGIGEALAHEFYKHGCQVVLCARRRQELERVRNDLLHSHCTLQTHPPIIIPLDLSDVDSLTDNVKKILSITKKIDILVNNGGISHRGRALTTDPDVDMKIMQVNYFGSVALTKAVLPGMIARKSGHIVVVSSIQGLVALPDRSAYSASKHALQAFSDSLRAEIAADNVSVTVASPGYVKTQLSMNALTGSGSSYGQMDSTTENGFSADYVAAQIVKAIVEKKKEVVISTILPKLAIFLRKYLPSLYFFVMVRRAKNSSLIK